MKRLVFLIVCIQQLLFTSLLFAENAENGFDGKLSALIVNSNRQKAVAIETLATLDDARVLPALKAMLDARLYYRKQDKQIVYLLETSSSVSISGVISGEDLGVVEKNTIKKIRINNKLRRVLRASISSLELTSSDAELRLNSAKNLIKVPNKTLRQAISAAIKTEKNREVKQSMQLALAMIDIDSDNQPLRMIAMQVIGDSISPDAVNLLARLSQRDEKGAYVEQNQEIAELAENRLKDAKSQLKFFKVIEDFIFGLSLGSILLLAAIGLAITFGVMGVINMAHGEMIMLGAYTTFAIQQLFPELIQYSIFIAIPVAFLVSGAVGVLIERLVIRHLYGRQLDTLLATFGISLILQQAVRMYSSNNVAVISPDFISGFWQMNEAVAITYNRIYVLFFSLIVLGVLALVLKKTLLGLQMRAVTQNRAMANSMGIHSSWVDALTFGLGSGIAGIAGVALSQFTNVGPNMGQGYIIDSFMVVVFGGVGNLLGTFFGAMSLGVANKFLEPYTGAVIAKIMVLVFIILFIQWRPRGLFALKGRFVED